MSNVMIKFSSSNFDLTRLVNRSRALTGDETLRNGVATNGTEMKQYESDSTVFVSERRIGEIRVSYTSSIINI